MKRRIVLQYLLWILLGAVCFFVAQPLTRIPLLHFVQGTVGFTMFSLLYPIAAIACIGFSAGIFEETARFLCKRFFLKPAKCSLAQPILFGLGHGAMEAGLLILPLLMSGYPLGQLWLGLVERALAIVLHIVLTILVWNGFQTNKKILYLVLAITVHGLVDSVFPALQRFNLSAIQIESIFGVVVLLPTVYAVYSQKYYIQGGQNGKENEKTENLS